jgi:hypothetical protein
VAGGVEKRDELVARQGHFDCAISSASALLLIDGGLAQPTAATLRFIGIIESGV